MIKAQHPKKAGVTRQTLKKGITLLEKKEK
jgi:hypothetical protein